MTILIDSDILIEVSRGRNAEIISQWLDLARADAAVLYSPVSVAELLSRVRRYFDRPDLDFTMTLLRQCGILMH